MVWLAIYQDSEANFREYEKKCNALKLQMAEHLVEVGKKEYAKGNHESGKRSFQDSLDIMSKGAMKSFEDALDIMHKGTMNDDNGKKFSGAVKNIFSRIRF